MACLTRGTACVAADQFDDDRVSVVDKEKTESLSGGGEDSVAYIRAFTHTDQCCIAQRHSSRRIRGIHYRAGKKFISTATRA